MELRRCIEEVYFFVGVSAFLGAYTDIPTKASTAQNTAEMGGSNVYSTIVMSTVLCLFVLLAAKEWPRLMEVAKRAPLLNWFVLFAAISAVWSLDPSVTLRRTTSLLTAISFAYYANVRFTMHGIIRRMAVVLIVAAVTSGMLALAMPSIGVMSDGLLAGDWSGVFVHKQQLGWAMFVACLCLVWLMVNEQGWRRLGYVGALGICVGLLVMANSETATISVAALPAMMVVTWVCRLSGLARIWAIYLLVLVTILGVAAVVLNLDSLMAGVIDRDESLTGRVPLWELLLDRTGYGLILGYGFGAFWQADNPIATYVIAVSGWVVPEAHNSYIDLLINLGIPGLIIGLCVLFGTMRRGMQAVASGVPWASFAVSYSIILAIAAISETLLFHAGGGGLEAMLLALLYVALRSRTVEVAAPIPLINISEPSVANIGEPSVA